MVNYPFKSRAGVWQLRSPWASLNNTTVAKQWQNFHFGQTVTIKSNKTHQQEHSVQMLPKCQHAKAASIIWHWLNNFCFLSRHNLVSWLHRFLKGHIFENTQWILPGVFHLIIINLRHWCNWHSLEYSYSLTPIWLTLYTLIHWLVGLKHLLCVCGEGGYHY